MSVFGIIAGNSLNNYVDYDEDIKQTIAGNRKHYYFEQYCKRCHYWWAYWISTLCYTCIVSACLVPYTYKWWLAILHYMVVLVYNIKLRQYQPIKLTYAANYFAMSFLFFDVSFMNYVCIFLYFLRTEVLYDDFENRHQHMVYRYIGISILICAIHAAYGQWWFAASNLFFVVWMYCSTKVDTRTYKLQMISYLLLF